MEGLPSYETVTRLPVYRRPNSTGSSKLGRLQKIYEKERRLKRSLQSYRPWEKDDWDFVNYIVSQFEGNAKFSYITDKEREAANTILEQRNHFSYVEPPTSRLERMKDTRAISPMISSFIAS